MTAWFFSLLLRSATHLCGSCCARTLTVRCPGSERHHAQNPLFADWVDPTGRGICDGGPLHPGARRHDSVSQAHEAAGLALSGSGQRGWSGISGKRHGWSPLLKVRPPLTSPAPLA